MNLTAQATDNEGASSTSSTVSINISQSNEPKPEPVSISRLNIGGESYQDWQADQFFTANGTMGAFINNTTPIAQTTDDALYQSERYGEFTYQIPVPHSGTYQVDLHFAEIYWGVRGGLSNPTGRRIFNVFIEEQEVISNLDIVAEVGPATALVKSFQVTVQDGNLTIRTQAIVDNPKISAIEIFGEDSQGSGQEDGTLAWNALPEAIERRTEPISLVIDNKYYVFAGLNDYIDSNNDGKDDLLTITGSTEVYDPESNTWTALSAMPTPVTHTGGVLYQNQVWFAGGFVGDNPGFSTDKVQIYDVATDTWSEGPSLPEPVASHGITRVAQYLHVFGGLMPDRKTDRDVHYVLDLDNPTAGWKNAAPLPIARNHLSAASVGGKIYAIGGQFNHDTFSLVEDLSYVHVYDPVLDSWEQTTDLPFQRSHFEPGTFVTPEGKIIIVGGRSEYGVPADQKRNKLENITQFDPDTQTWEDIGEIPEPLLAPASKLVQENLIVSHGATVWFNPIRKAHISPFSLPIRRELGINPGQMNITLQPGGSLSQSVYIWSYGETVDLSVQQDSLSQSWLTLAQLPTSTDPLSREMILEINTQGLASGIYQTTLLFQADGYQTVSLPVEINVEAASADSLSASGQRASESLISDSQLDKYLLYPNPVVDYLSIEPFNPESELGVYNKLGQLQAVPRQGQVLEVSQLKPGLYFLRIDEQTYQFLKE